MNVTDCTATAAFGAIESASIERAEVLPEASSIATVAYRIRIGDLIVGYVFAYDRVSERAASGYVKRWGVVRAAYRGVTSLDRPTRTDAIATLLTWIGYAEADAAAVAPRVALY